MSSPIREAYSKLTASFEKRHNLSHAYYVMMWDNFVNLPPGSGAARKAAIGEIEGRMHDELLQPSNLESIKFLFASENQEQVAQELNEIERANIREMKRLIESKSKLSKEVVERKSKLMSEAELTWRVARKENDWNKMEPILQQLFDLAREMGELLLKGREGENLTVYDALIEQFEPGMTCAIIDGVFADLKTWLPDAIKARVAAQGEMPPLPTVDKFPIEKQKALNREVMEKLNFDFTRGRADVSVHPFTGLVPEDVRLTTRYAENEFEMALMGTIHETGHAMYEQHRPGCVAGNAGGKFDGLISQPVASARGFGVHEGQSLFHEMQMGRSLPFQKFITPLIKKHLDIDISPEILLKRSLAVKSTNKIRVNADEMTYPLHVLIRYEIEKDVLDRKLAVKDIPDAWNQKMKEYLNVDTTGDFADGPLQDIHWNIMYIGFFPTYTLGSIYAAQFMAALRRDLGDEKVDADIEKGDFTAIQQWLREKVWNCGSLYETPELLKRATGEPFTGKYFKEHILKRYTI